jgi:hypothetical protein
MISMCASSVPNKDVVSPDCSTVIEVLPDLSLALPGLSPELPGSSPALPGLALALLGWSPAL